MTDLVVLILVCIAAIATVVLRKLTVPGAIAGLIIALGLYAGAGFTGLLMLGAFFVSGTVATAAGTQKKSQLGLSEKNKGQRQTGQVLANGAVACFAGIIAWQFPEYSKVAVLAAAAALASATADTLSSELGNLYGRRYFNILTLKKDTRGADGVISFEGSLWGVAGSLLITSIYFMGTGNLVNALYVLIGGVAGNTADSILGASVQRKGWLTNSGVNWANTLAAALVAALLY